MAFGKTWTGFTLHHLQVVHLVWLIGSDYYHLSIPVEPIHLGPPGDQWLSRLILAGLYRGLYNIYHMRYLLSKVSSLQSLCLNRPFKSSGETLANGLDSDKTRKHWNSWSTRQWRWRCTVSGDLQPFFCVSRTCYTSWYPMSSPSAVSHSEKDPDQAAAYTTEILKLQQLGYAVKMESNAETPSGLHLLFPIPHGPAQQEEHSSI